MHSEFELPKSKKGRAGMPRSGLNSVPDAPNYPFSLALAAARSARAALHPSDNCVSCSTMHWRMAPLARSTSAQCLAMSAAQAARTFSRISWAVDWVGAF
ncbi:MAG TPA: hypothetical protein VJ740_06295 [Hyphomicrobiaceae bacterium]|nr:hypothetical protein [Hyphomicrobiaceae bacterium]